MTADPPRLLAAGPRTWALDSLPAMVELRTGLAGAGTLTFDVHAASCLGDECRLHQRRVAVPVRLLAGGGGELSA